MLNLDKFIQLNPSIQAFFWLIFAHAIGDMGLQTCYIAEHKHKRFNVLFAHCIIWAGCIGVALKYLHIYSSWKMAFLILNDKRIYTQTDI